MPERKAPIADVLAACQAAYEKIQHDGMPVTTTPVADLVGNFPKLRAELERLQIIQANMKTEISVLWTALQRNSAALRELGCVRQVGEPLCFCQANAHTSQPRCEQARAALGDPNG